MRYGAVRSGTVPPVVPAINEPEVSMDPIVKIWSDLIDKYLARMPMRDRRERLDALEKAVKLARERYPL